MKKVFIVLLFILLGSALIVVNNTDKNVENSFTIVYENNKNLALPDLTSKTEITDGLYRIWTNNLVSVDYHKYTGEYEINGSVTATNYLGNYYDTGTYLFTPTYLSGTLTVKVIHTGGSKTTTDSSLVIDLQNPPSVAPPFNVLLNGNTRVFENQNRAIIYTGETGTFTNYKFKIQLEKGSLATDYVIPKLIPIYKDNLSMEEKQKIGLGAFGGITKIIKTINDIIKPVGDFINGLLSMF